MISKRSLLTFSSARALFDKCIFEHNQLSITRSDPERGYLIFNLIISLNHLLDWVAKDESIDKNTKIKIIRHFWPYKEDERPSDSLDDYRAEKFTCNIEQRLILLLCNKTKHYKIKKTSKDVETSVWEVSSYLYGENRLLGEDLYTSNSETIYLAKQTGDHINILRLIDTQIKAWRQFFN